MSDILAKIELSSRKNIRSNFVQDFVEASTFLDDVLPTNVTKEKTIEKKRDLKSLTHLIISQVQTLTSASKHVFQKNERDAAARLVRKRILKFGISKLDTSNRCLRMIEAFVNNKKQNQENEMDFENNRNNKRKISAMQTNVRQNPGKKAKKTRTKKKTYDKDTTVIVDDVYKFHLDYSGHLT